MLRKKTRPCGARVLNGTCPKQVSAEFVCYWHGPFEDESEDGSTFAERLESVTPTGRPTFSKAFQAMRDR